MIQFVRWAQVKKGMVIIIINIVMLVGMILLLDKVLSHNKSFSWGPDSEATEPTLSSFNLYPFTGFHVQSNFIHAGPLNASNGFYTNYAITTGDKGFFIDHPLASFPVKRENDYRIILTGGSTAQGLGAQSNDHMIYRHLESILNDWLKKMNDPRHIEIINLAMTSSFTYQNYIALNRWGHALKPDLIVSFSGGNDILVPHFSHSDLPASYDNLLAMVDASKYYNSPQWVKSLKEKLPGLVGALRIDQIARMYQMNRFVREAKERYSRENFMDAEASANFYVHALASIHRDFAQIPLLCVLQPLNGTILEDASKPLPPDQVTNVEVYEDGLKRVQAELQAKEIPGIFLYNMHDMWKANNTGSIGPKLYTDNFAHFTNEGQELVAKQLADIVKLHILKTRQ